jgi:hypothetical protein
MQCQNCGAQLREGAVFCSTCGQRQTQPQGQTLQAPAPPAGGAWQSGAAGPGPAGGPPYAGGSAPGPGPAYPPPRRSAAGFGGPRAAGGFDLNVVMGRLRRLARLDTSVFREARDDPGALIPSLVIVAVSILLMAVGNWLWAELEFGDVGLDRGRLLVRSVIVGTVFGVALWVAWVALAAVILQQGFRRQAEIVSLLGALGFAALPMVLGFLMLIDVLRVAFGVGSLMAAAVAMQVGFQETTDATPGEAFIANLAGLGLFVIALTLLGRGDAGLAPGIFTGPSFDISSLFR